MSENKYTRRNLLRSGAAAAGTAVVGSMAGCGGILGGNGGGGDPVKDVVPARAQMVAFMDLQGMVTDDNLRTIANAYLDEVSGLPGYEGPTSVEEAIEQAESQSGDSNLSSDSFESMTLFAEVENADPENPYGGAAVVTSLSQDEFTTALEEQGASYTESEYNGHTIYTPESGSGGEMPTGGLADEGVVGWLGDGQFVGGTQEVVEDAIDVFEGDEDGIGGDLETRYDGVSEGYLRFATVVPEDTFPEGQGGGGPGLNLAPFQNIQYISGNFVSSGDTVSLSINHHTGSESEATELQEAVDGIKGMGQMFAGNNEMLGDVIGNITVETDGSTVITAYEENVDTLSEYARELVAAMSGGMGGGGMGNVVAPAGA